jgi:hypothetical protein
MSNAMFIHTGIPADKIFHRLMIFTNRASSIETQQINQVLVYRSGKSADLSAGVWGPSLKKYAKSDKKYK